MKKFPLVVIGAGAAGLIIAIGYARAGKKVLLIEKGTYGGDCTNFGCIPSKSLIASGKIAHAIQKASSMGIDINTSFISADNALERVRRIVYEVRSHEDEAALQKIGVETITGSAEFQDAHYLQITAPNGEKTVVFANKIVIATGSSPTSLPSEKLKSAPYLTNETIFDLKQIPSELAILGAGPIGCELAQAFSRLKSTVYLIHSSRGLLPNDEKEIQNVLVKQFQKEGIQLLERCDEHPIEYQDKKFKICVLDQRKEHKILKVEHLLVSIGRSPNVSELKLENAHVKFSSKGIEVNSYGQTNQKHIFAIGDVIGAPFFTHFAEHQGRALLRNLLLPFFLKKKVLDKQPIPHVTFTDPEVASIGMHEKQATEKYGNKHIAIYKVAFNQVDRAITEDETDGFIKIVTKKWSSQILGATIVGPRSGEMLMELSCAIYGKIPLKKLSDLIHPYPIYSAAIRKAADLWLTQTILPLFKSLLFKRKS